MLSDEQVGAINAFVTERSKFKTVVEYDCANETFDSLAK